MDEETTDKVFQEIERLKGNISKYIGKEIFVYKFKDDGPFINIGFHRLNWDWS